MRNLLRRSFSFVVGVLLTATLLGSDFSAEPANAIPLRSRPVTASGRSIVKTTPARRPYVKPRRWGTRPSRARTSRSAVRARAVAPKAVRPKAVRPKAVRPKAVRPEAVRPQTVPAADVWARLRQCESGGNYRINTGNGYYGAYQFHPRTWRGLGYPGLPHQAPPAMQDEAARKLQARSGWGQWPACSRRLGLR